MTEHSNSPKPPGAESAAKMAECLRDTDAAIDTVKALSHEIQEHAAAVKSLAAECDSIRAKIRAVDGAVYPDGWDQKNPPFQAARLDNFLKNR